MKTKGTQEQLILDKKLTIPIKFTYSIQIEKLVDYHTLDENTKFKEPELLNGGLKVDFIKPLNIFLSALICLSFYSLLIIIILKPNTFSTILFVIIFFIGHFAQSQVIPEIPSFKSKEEFNSKIIEILNSKVIIKDENNENNSLVKYTKDATGKIKIPENIKLIKFDKIIILSEKNICDELVEKNLKDKICFDNSKKNIKNIVNPEEIYWISKSPISHPVNGLTIILSLLLLQWIQALYYILTWKMVIIYPIKIAVPEIKKEEYKELEQTKINIHGDEYTSNGILKNDLQQNEIKEKHTIKIISINPAESMVSSDDK